METKQLPNKPSSPTAVGRQAELVASKYLIANGFSILNANWRTRWCEIDLVARRGAVLHIIEVKYRKSAQWGSPAEYIGNAKAARLKRAAAAYVQSHRYVGAYQIDAIGVEGNLENPRVHLIENAVGD